MYELFSYPAQGGGTYQGKIAFALNAETPVSAGAPGLGDWDHHLGLSGLPRLWSGRAPLRNLSL